MDKVHKDKWKQIINAEKKGKKMTVVTKVRGKPHIGKTHFDKMFNKKQDENYNVKIHEANNTKTKGGTRQNS